MLTTESSNRACLLVTESTEWQQRILDTVGNVSKIIHNIRQEGINFPITLQLYVLVIYEV